MLNEIRSFVEKFLQSDKTSKNSLLEKNVKHTIIKKQKQKLRETLEGRKNGNKIL